MSEMVRLLYLSRSCTRPSLPPPRRRNSRTHRVHIAERLISLTVTLGQLDGIVVVEVVESVVGDVLHPPSPTSSLEVAGHGRLDAGPDFDPGSILMGRSDMVA